jgi:hypothetical protein
MKSLLAILALTLFASTSYGLEKDQDRIVVRSVLGTCKASIAIDLRKLGGDIVYINLNHTEGQSWMTAGKAAKINDALKRCNSEVKPDQKAEHYVDLGARDND